MIGHCDWKGHTRGIWSALGRIRQALRHAPYRYSYSSVLEAGCGSLWNEDPRYFRATDQPVKGRIQNILVITFTPRRAMGVWRRLTPDISVKPEATSFRTLGVQ